MFTLCSFHSELVGDEVGRLKRQTIERDRGDGPIPARLGDIAIQGLNVFCWCNRCSHCGELDAVALTARLGPDLPVPEIGARLRCSGCGAKDVATRPGWPSLGQVAHHQT